MATPPAAGPLYQDTTDTRIPDTGISGYQELRLHAQVMV